MEEVVYDWDGQGTPHVGKEAIDETGADRNLFGDSLGELFGEKRA